MGYFLILLFYRLFSGKIFRVSNYVVCVQLLITSMLTVFYYLLEIFNLKAWWLTKETRPSFSAAVRLLWHSYNPCFLFVFCSVVAEENGHGASASEKRPPSEDTSVTSGLVETVSKSALPSQTTQVSEEQSAAPTPVKKSSKMKQQIDVKAELEKRQGGKQLLNLVVIGNALLKKKKKSLGQVGDSGICAG